MGYDRVVRDWDVHHGGHCDRLLWEDSPKLADEGFPPILHILSTRKVNQQWDLINGQVVDLESGEPVAAGVRGEVCIKGAQVNLENSLSNSRRRHLGIAQTFK